jgi:prephenate dehydrogenase
VWADLIEHTATDAAKLLRELGAQVGELAARLEVGDVEAVSELMARTRGWRTGPSDPAGRTSP